MDEPARPGFRAGHRVHEEGTNKENKESYFEVIEIIFAVRAVHPAPFDKSWAACLEMAADMAPGAAARGRLCLYRDGNIQHQGKPDQVFPNPDAPWQEIAQALGEAGWPHGFHDADLDPMPGAARAASSPAPGRQMAIERAFGPFQLLNRQRLVVLDLDMRPPMQRGNKDEAEPVVPVPDVERVACWLYPSGGSHTGKTQVVLFDQSKTPLAPAFEISGAINDTKPTEHALQALSDGIAQHVRGYTLTDERPTEA